MHCWVNWIDLTIVTLQVLDKKNLRERGSICWHADVVEYSEKQLETI